MFEFDDTDSGEVGEADFDSGLYSSFLVGVNDDRGPRSLDDLLLPGVKSEFRGDAGELLAGNEDLLVGVVATLEAED